MGGIKDSVAGTKSNRLGIDGVYNFIPWEKLLFANYIVEPFNINNLWANNRLNLNLNNIFLGIDDKYSSILLDIF